MTDSVLRRAPLLALAAALLLGCGQRHDLRVEEVRVPSAPHATEAADAALAVEPATGDLLLTWAAGQEREWGLWFARTSDGGATWTEPVRVASGPGEVRPFGESSPRLVATGPGTIGIVWPNSVRVEGRRWPGAMMRFSRSEDGGRTWSAPVTLNDDSAAAPVSHQFHGAAWAGDSGIVVAWLDERHVAEEQAQRAAAGAPPGDPTDEPDATIYSVVSTDLGRTWGPNRRLWGQVCPCCRVSLARMPTGEVVSAWRKHFTGNVRDVVTAPLDAGAEPRVVNDDGWVYPGCPNTGPAMSVGEDGVTHVAWFTGKEGASGVLYRALDAGGRPLAPAAELLTARTLPPGHPAVAALPGGGAVVAYDLAEGGRRGLTLAEVDGAGRVLRRRALEVQGEVSHPRLALVDDRTAVIAWTAREGERRSVRVARVRLGG